MDMSPRLIQKYIEERGDINLKQQLIFYRLFLETKNENSKSNYNTL